MIEMGIRGARQLEERAVALLKPHARNPRTHSKKQIGQIEASIRRFGFVNPVLVDEKDRIIAGHGRVEAARSLGLASVPVIRLEGMSEAEKKAYIIADNRLAELAGWDRDLLTLELGSILEDVPDFDLELTGFDGGELEALLAAIGNGVGSPDSSSTPISVRPAEVMKMLKGRLPSSRAMPSSIGVSRSSRKPFRISCAMARVARSLGSVSSIIDAGRG
ncbi:ParB/Srx family N-terminal domain-containing protein [Sphingobium algorifonticola]|uniref:ParB-like N-terminal domain-containing protein n=1 Tax=Sphingobium algorifonticola TaxID=2008318 RepID=A0A437JDD8_9SPHN|nr:ParB/Srx family N-terminal domain-containing protein [Sphingobium algorifonticola]RVT43946.1 hypothetical protein ENE74_05045 [Sphingobium algorifonticola]